MAKWAPEAADALARAMKEDTNKEKTNAEREEELAAKPKRLSIADLERLYDHG